MIKASRAISLAVTVVAAILAAPAGDASAATSRFPVTTKGGAMTVDAHGRIVVAAIGWRCAVPYNCDSARLLVTRLEPNGRLDRSFAEDGLAARSLPASPDAAVTGLAIDGAGRIVAAAQGLGSLSGEYPTMTVLRLRKNGDPDVTFGEGGAETVSAQTFSPGFFGQKLAVDSAGRVLVAGTAYAGGGIAALRLLPDGSIDSGFGNAGVASLRLDPDDIEESGSAVTTTAGGRIVVGATAEFRDDLHADATVVAFTDAGEVDTTFGGGDGVVSFGWLAPYYDSVLATVGRVLSGPQGRLVMVGSGVSGLIHPCDNYASARLTPDGALDPSYGDGGIAYPRLPLCGRPTDAVLDGADRLAVPLVSPSIIVLARQDADGSLDARFGDDGRIGMRLEKRKRSSVDAVAKVSGGKLLAAGYAESDRCTRTGGQRHLHSCTALLLTRFLSDGTVDRSFGTDGFVTKPQIVPR